MIIKRSWMKFKRCRGSKYCRRFSYVGYFLFGFIPLYLSKKELSYFG